MERQPVLADGRPVARHGVDVGRAAPVPLAEGLQPAQAVLAVLGPLDHVEDGQDRLVGLGGLAEEAADRGVVELLLGEDGDQDVGGVG